MCILEEEKCIVVAGTTWLQEIVYLIQTDLDFETSANKLLSDRFPYIEFRVDVVTESTSPRLMKSHLPHEFMPNDLKQGKGKVDIIIFIYFIRECTVTLLPGAIESYPTPGDSRGSSSPPRSISGVSYHVADGGSARIPLECVQPSLSWSSSPSRSIHSPEHHVIFHPSCSHHLSELAQCSVWHP